MLGRRRCRDRKKKEVESGEYEAGDRKIFSVINYWRKSALTRGKST